MNKDEVWPSINDSRYSLEKKIVPTDFLSLNSESDTINSDKVLDFDSSTLYEEKRFKIINTKTEYSLITKLIRKNLREDEITDVLRMTFVVDNEEKLKRVSKHIETNYTSFGRELKIENRGYEHIVSTSTSSTVKKNLSKSNDYKSLRYVLKIPIRSEKGQKPHAREVEIRILHLDDLGKERSQYHHASHDAYKNRREIECAQTLYPRELYPELYETFQDENDVFGRKEYKLITTI